MTRHDPAALIEQHSAWLYRELVPIADSAIAQRLRLSTEYPLGRDLVDASFVVVLERAQAGGVSFASREKLRNYLSSTITKLVANAARKSARRRAVDREIQALAERAGEQLWVR